MALQKMDSCDLFDDWNDLVRRYPATLQASSFLVSSTLGRFGGYCLHGNHSAGSVYLPVTGLPKTIYWAGAIKAKGELTYDRAFLTFNSSLGIQAQLTLGVGNIPKAFRGTSPLLGTGTGAAMNGSGYTFLEVKMVIGNAGSVEIRADGDVILDLGPVDTEQWDEGLSHIGMNLMDGTGVYVDDFFWYDSTGSEINDFTGDRRIDYLVPNGDGSVQFTKSGGSTNWELVDELNGADDDGTYNHSLTVGHIDRLNLTTLAATPDSIDAVQAVVVVRKTDAGSTRAKVGVYSGTTAGKSATAEGLSTDYQFLDHQEELNPDDAAAWEKADIDGLQVLYEVG